MKDLGSLFPYNGKFSFSLSYDGDVLQFFVDNLTEVSLDVDNRATINTEYSDVLQISNSRISTPDKNDSFIRVLCPVHFNNLYIQGNYFYLNKSRFFKGWY